MSIQLTLKTPIAHAVSLASLLPERLSLLDSASIGEIQLVMGRDSYRCSELFEIQILEDQDAWTIRFVGDLSHAHGIGQDMLDGHIEISGNVGNDLGLRLQGGSIKVSGNVANRAGVHMSGGFIEICGNAGDDLGGNLSGFNKGMRGGTILLNGTAGDRVAQRMRRGLIAIAGDVGSAAGHAMIAGTLLIEGTCGPHLGLGMKRGTILLNRSGSRESLPDTFEQLGDSRPVYLDLLHHSLLRYEFQKYDLAGRWNLKQSRFAYIRGDQPGLGLGEVFVREATS